MFEFKVRFIIKLLIVIKIKLSIGNFENQE